MLAATPALALAFAIAATPASGSSVDIYVSPSGDDDTASTATLGTGPSRPFRTLRGARDAARAALRQHDGNVDVSVNLLDGVYAEPLELGPGDSGTATHPVVWRRSPHPHPQSPQGAEPAGVLISGGLPIPASAFSPWSEGPPGAVKANLTALGVADLGCLAGEQGQSTVDPSLLPTTGDVRSWDTTGIAELFFNNQPAVLARWPNLHKNGSNHWAYTAATFPNNCSKVTSPCCSSACSAFRWRNDSVPAKAAAWEAEIEARRKHNSQLPRLHGYW